MKSTCGVCQNNLCESQTTLADEKHGLLLLVVAVLLGRSLFSCKAKSRLGLGYLNYFKFDLNFNAISSSEFYFRIYKLFFSWTAALRIYFSEKYSIIMKSDQWFLYINLNFIRVICNYCTRLFNNIAYYCCYMEAITLHMPHSFCFCCNRQDLNFFII